MIILFLEDHGGQGKAMGDRKGGQEEPSSPNSSRKGIPMVPKMEFLWSQKGNSYGPKNGISIVPKREYSYAPKQGIPGPRGGQPGALKGQIRA